MQPNAELKTTNIQFEEDPPRQEAAEHHADALLLNIEGYEGPIDVLLVMARDQKLDLTKISILQLARQYLEFIDRAVELKLELAAEYLVMAAWLAYLKSRLLLPKQQDDEEPDAETIAEALQFQLRRLEAMQKAADDLFSLPQLGQDIFPRGMPEGVRTSTSMSYEGTLYDLLSAYGNIRRRHEHKEYKLPTFNLMSHEEAIERVSDMLGRLPRKGNHSVWTTLHSFLPDDNNDHLYTRSALATTLTASLELTKQGLAEIRQDGSFRPVYLRGCINNSEIN